MKQIYFLAVFYFVNLGFSQNKIDNDSPFLKSIKVEKLNDQKFDYIQNASLSWDFSSVELNNSDVSIEVVTIFDCFNGEQASDFKQQFTILNKDNFTLKGSSDLIHLDLMAKCFKWRLVVKNSETQVSDWSYFSFLK